MDYKQKSFFVALAFLFGLEFIFFRIQILDFKSIILITLFFNFLVAGLTLWVLNFFKKWSFKEIIADLTYFILPTALFWGVVFLFLSFENVVLKQSIIILSSMMAYLISWSFCQDRTQSILAFNILSLSTLFVSFFLYSTIWFFYLTFSLASWQLLVLVFAVSLLLFYQMINLCFSFNLLFLVAEIVFSLVMVEIAWILIFWPTDHLVASLILTLAFYLIWGVFSHHLEGRLNMRIIIEYLLVMIVILALILKFTPWFLFQK